jgi:TetR/AcrR family transcriptional regulator, repressor of fatR-cypB operon
MWQGIALLLRGDPGSSVGDALTKLLDTPPRNEYSFYHKDADGMFIPCRISRMPRVRTRSADSPKREAILQAALELFAERGFHGTTMPEISAKARVGAGTLYRYFDSKEQLVNDLYQHWKGEFGRFLMADLPIYLPREMFRELWRRLWQFYARHPRVVRFLELHHHGSYLDRRSVAMEEAVLEPLERFVIAAQRAGALSQVPARIVIALVYGGFVGLVHAAIRNHIVPTEEVQRAAEEALWTAITSTT